MRDALVVLAWIAVATVVLATIAFVVLRWLALRIAARVAEAAEARLAISLDKGLDKGITRAGRLLPDLDQQRRYLAQIDRIAWLMDRVVPLPILGGIGLDAILGLFPVVGDVASFAISAVIVIRAAQLGAPRALLSRLIAIQITDLALGAVPILGDLLDTVYQADQKSARLIREFMASTSAGPPPGPASSRSRGAQ